MQRFRTNIAGLLLVLSGFVTTGVMAGPANKSADKIPTNSRFVISGNQAYDTKTNLTWARCSVGQKWVEGTGCEGKVELFNWHDAQEIKHHKWRVPTKDELVSLIDQSRKEQFKIPTIDVVVFPNMDQDKLVYWTSTSTDRMHAWNVNFFGAGIYGYYGKAATFAVRLVKSGK